MVDPVSAWGEELVQLEHQIARLELQAARLAAELAGDAPEDFISMVDWLRFSCHLTSTAAADRLNVGKHLAKLPESVQALNRTQIGYSHLKVMARTAQAVGGRFDERELLPLALEHSPGKFHFKCLHYRHAVSRQKFDEEQENLHEARSLRLTTAEDGCLLISGCLDPVGGAVVRNAVEALAKLSRENDDRTREQRLADGLVELAEMKTDVQLQVTASVETLLGLAGASAADMEFSLPISARSVERMACDCNLVRVLLDAESVVVDVGRSTPKVSPAMKRGLQARDGGCRWPGCERPGRYCEGHHLKHWAKGGETVLANLILLCRRHHFLVHEGGWELRGNVVDGFIAIPPRPWWLADLPAA